MAEDVTRLLSAMDQGDPRAAEELLPLVYGELRRLAAQRMGNERAGHTLGATALVHEAYLRLVGVDPREKWNGRGHFFGAAARAMRRILVESARRRQAMRRGGDLQREDLDPADLCDPKTGDDVLALHEALEKLEKKDPMKSELVTLRFFGGLTVEEAAQALGISVATAHRNWAYARAWLHQELAGESRI